MPLSKEQYQNVESLANSAINAITKRDAQPYIDDLISLQMGLSLENKSLWSTNDRWLLSELISYVKTASGKVIDKETYCYIVRNSLSKLKPYF